MRAALLLLLSLASAGCTDQSMTRQPHYGTNDPAPAFANGSAARPLPEGTVSQDDKEYDRATAVPPPVDMALLERGKERFEIF